MKKMVTLLTSLFVLICITLPAFSAPQQNKIQYEKRKKDEVMNGIREKRKQLKKEKSEITQKIREGQETEEKAARAGRKVLKADMGGVFPPASPADFKRHFHFPPVPQYMTSTCWSFSNTSYFESEIFRLTGKKIKLSEMWAPYYELIEKCRRYITERGESLVSGGAQSNSVTRMWKKHGIVPAEVYPGVKEKDGKHDHGAMMKEVHAYLEYIEANNLWDEKDNLGHIALILDKHMGKPPESFSYNGKTMTPKEFLEKETGLNLDDYYSVMSTYYFPFYTRGEFRAPDNWWHSKVYLNLPLEEWYGVVKKTINAGYTMVIGGDVSEPGKVGEKDVCFVPSFDIPGKYINQDSREYRIYNKTTGDDHAIHLVGYKKYKGKDWYLLKDSGRSSRHGKHHGYYFFRADFIRLKMLTFTVHKDMLKDILPKVK